MRMGQAAKLLLISFDSTIRSNLSVGMPIDLLIYRKDRLEVEEQRRIEESDPYFRRLSKGWSLALREAFTHIDEYGEDVQPPAQPERAAAAARAAVDEAMGQATAGWFLDDE
jgi:putative proteasome-type protease